MQQILVICGTRPEAIKLAPVILALRETEPLLETTLLLSGQHRDMVRPVLDAFGIHPDLDLDLMRAGQDPCALAGRLMVALDEILAARPPAMVIVHGDTTTAMAASMAAFHHHVPVAHVEAGLRTGSLDQPFPEELNRRVADLVSRIHFAPTDTARSNLVHEHVPADRIEVTGNTVVDALRLTLADPAVQALPAPFTPGRRGILVTAHRRENQGLRLREICRALSTLARDRDDIEILLPMHPSPAVRGPIQELLQGHDRIHLVDPAPYPLFVRWLHDAHLILTDSGGIQEEAPSLGTPVLVMRETSERPEALDCGAARLVGTVPATIVSTVKNLLDDRDLYLHMARRRTIYGDGFAAERIRARILDELEIDATEHLYQGELRQ